MPYVIELETGNFLRCYERMGDSHYTFGAVLTEREAAQHMSKFDWRVSAIEAANAYKLFGTPFGRIQQIKYIETDHYDMVKGGY
jgi:hypothetical protein